MTPIGNVAIGEPAEVIVGGRQLSRAEAMELLDTGETAWAKSGRVSARFSWRGQSFTATGWSFTLRITDRAGRYVCGRWH